MSFTRRLLRNKAKEMYKQEKPVNLKNEKIQFNEYYKDKITQNKIEADLKDVRKNAKPLTFKDSELRVVKE